KFRRCFGCLLRFGTCSVASFSAQKQKLIVIVPHKSMTSLITVPFAGGTRRDPVFVRRVQRPPRSGRGQLQGGVREIHLKAGRRQFRAIVGYRKRRRTVPTVSIRAGGSGVDAN